MKQVSMFLGIILGFLMIPFSIYADQISVSESATTGSFSLVESGNASALVVDSLDAEVVTIAANALSAEIKLITGVASSVVNSIKWH